MTSPMPEPNSSPGGSDSAGGTGKPPQFTAQNAPANISPEVGYPGANTVPSRGTWFLRPTPRPVYQPATTNAVQQQAYDDAINFDYYQPSQLAGAYDSLSPQQQQFFNIVAKSSSKRSTGKGLFNNLVKEAERQNVSGDNRVSPFDLVAEIAKDHGILDATGNFSDAAKQAMSQDLSGSTSPKTSVSRSLMDPQSAEMLLNKLAVNLDFFREHAAVLLNDFARGEIVAVTRQ